MIASRLTLAESAKVARVSERTLRRAFADPVRPLRHARIGRRVVIAPADLDAWLERHTAPLPSPPGLFAGFAPDVRALLEDLFCTDSAPKHTVSPRRPSDDSLTRTPLRSRKAS